MMLTYLAILSIAVAVVLSGKAPPGCSIGDQWTKNFIRYECVKGGQSAIGCAPTNTGKGAVIEPGKTFQEKNFTYECAKNGGIITYKIASCVAPNGETVKIGDTTTLKDGSTWKCHGTSGSTQNKIQ